MTTATELLKAPQVGVKEFRDHQARYINSSKTIVLLNHGKRVKALVDFEDILQLLEFIEEFNDRELVHDVRLGRENIKNKKTIPADKLLANHRLSRHKK